MKRAKTDNTEPVSAEVMEARHTIIAEMMECMRENLCPEPGTEAAVARISRLLGTLRLAVEMIGKDPGVPARDKEVQRLRRRIAEFEKIRRELTGAAVT